MTRYEQIIERSILCWEKAQHFLQKKEYDLAKFWFNTSKCYKAKAYELTIEQAEEIV